MVTATIKDTAQDVKMDLNSQNYTNNETKDFGDSRKTAVKRGGDSVVITTVVIKQMKGEEAYNMVDLASGRHNTFRRICFLRLAAAILWNKQKAASQMMKTAEAVLGMTTDQLAFL